MVAEPKLAESQITKHGVSFVLPGKFMSDPIEGCFGWYRQMSSGSFFLSVSLKAEMKIRSLSLLQQQALSASCLAALDPVPPANVSSATAEDVSELAD